MNKIETTLDLRRVKSQNSFKKSFWNLLSQKDYTKITIKDISEDSGLNRKTFYRNFENIEDLMLASFTDLLLELSMPYARFQENERITPDLFTLCTKDYIAYILKEQKYFRLIFQNHLEGFAQIIWKDIFVTAAPDYVILHPSNAPILTKANTMDLYSNYAAFAAWGGLEWVLRHTDLSLDELLEQTMDATFAYLYNYFVSYQIDHRFGHP